MPDDQRPSLEVFNGARFIEYGNWLHSDFVKIRNSATTPAATFFCIANATWPIVIRGLNSTTGLTKSSPSIPRYKNASTPKQPANFCAESSAARRGSSHFAIASSLSARSASRNCLMSGAQSKNGLLNRVPTYLRPAVTRDRVQPRHFVKLFDCESLGTQWRSSVVSAKLLLWNLTPHKKDRSTTRSNSGSRTATGRWAAPSRNTKTDRNQASSESSNLRPVINRL